MSFDQPFSRIDKARIEKKEKFEKLFEELLSRPRSFFSLNQLRKARKISDGKTDENQVFTDDDLLKSRMKIRLNLVNVKCINCEKNGNTPTLNMDGIIHKLKCKYCMKDDVVRG